MRIVAIHGIAQQVKGEESLRAEWLPSLRDGLTRAGARGLLPDDRDLFCAYYGDFFRERGGPRDKSLDYPWEAEDVQDEWEKAILHDWWEEAARVDAVQPPDDTGTKGRTPRFVQSALDALSASRFFCNVAHGAAIGNLKQVNLYLHDKDVRAGAKARLADAVDPASTRVVIGHSLGSIVAYETLCDHPEWSVRMFITLGSPLGIRNLIFDRLQPPPVDGKGAWPGSVQRWVNVADDGDVVALTKKLAPLFHGAVEDVRVNNDAEAHDVRPYLTSAETGAAIAAGLAD